MQLPVAIHNDVDSGYGVTVPDVPGCFSAGDTVEEAIQNAKVAVLAHMKTLLELGEGVAVQSSDIELLRAMEDYVGATWALVEVDLSALDRLSGIEVASLIEARWAQRDQAIGVDVDEV